MQFKLKPNYRSYKRYFTNVKHLYKRRDVVVYTGLTLSFFAISFFGFFALRPTIVTIAGLLKEIEEKREINQKLDKRLSSLRQAQANYALVADSKNLVDETLPEKPELSQLVYQLEGLAQEQALLINSLGVESVTLLGKPPRSKTEEKASVSEINFSTTLEGDFSSLSDFLLWLGQLRRAIRVDPFSFTKSEREGQSIIKLNIGSKAFFYSKEQD